jgi:hypothetical protein
MSGVDWKVNSGREIGKVVAVDLIERCVPRAGEIAAVGAPFAVRRAGLGGQPRDAQHHQKEHCSSHIDPSGPPPHDQSHARIAQLRSARAA